MEILISVENISGSTLSAPARLSFPYMVVTPLNFPPPSNYTEGTAIHFSETGKYKISINLNLHIKNVESFVVLAFDQYHTQIPTSEISYLDQVETKDFTVSSSFFHQFNRGDSIYIRLNSLSPINDSSSATFQINPSSNINIFKL